MDGTKVSAIKSERLVVIWREMGRNGKKRTVCSNNLLQIARGIFSVFLPVLVCLFVFFFENDNLFFLSIICLQDSPFQIESLPYVSLYLLVFLTLSLSHVSLYLLFFLTFSSPQVS